MRFPVRTFLVLAMLAPAAGCGSNTGTNPPANDGTSDDSGVVSVGVTPTAVTLSLGQSQQFTATVGGTSNTAVTWSVDAGASHGSITPGGLFTAPGTLPSPATATVRATSVADNTKSATAAVMLEAPAEVVSVSVSPESATVELGQTQQFTATVEGTPETAVTWSVDEGASHGSVNADGLFTAPATLPSPATATVRATSVADNTKSSTASVTLVAGSGLTAGEKTLMGQLGRVGWNALLLSDQSIEGAVDAVFAASIASGGALTTTGTLTQAGDGSFSYTATPTDRLVVSFNTGLSAEFFVTGFAGDFSSESAFRSSHNNLTFRVKTGTLVDLEFMSLASESSYQRTITGTMGDDGTALTVNLTHTGSVSGSSEDRTWVDGITGTATSDAGEVTVNASTEYRIVTFDNTVEQWKRFNQGSATAAGTSFTLQDVLVQGTCTNNIVSEVDFWRAEGAVGRDGIVVGQLRYLDPVIAGLPCHQPQAVIEIAGGETIPL